MKLILITVGFVMKIVIFRQFSAKSRSNVLVNDSLLNAKPSEFEFFGIGFTRNFVKIRLKLSGFICTDFWGAESCLVQFGLFPVFRVPVDDSLQESDHFRI